MAQTKKMSQPQSKQSNFVESKEVKIKRVNPDNILPIFVNDFLITHSENEFFLTFSVIEPPAILDFEELNLINNVDAITRIKAVLTLHLQKRY